MTTKFEEMVNGGKIGSNAINVIVIDLQDGATFDAWINADTLSEVDSMIPPGYEMDTVTTLQSYFEPGLIDKYSIELVNSQHVYFSNFTKLVDGGLYEYTDALDRDDMRTVNKLDRLASK